MPMIESDFCAEFSEGRWRLADLDIKLAIIRTVMEEVIDAYFGA
jgi:hypothetical protein